MRRKCFILFLYLTTCLGLATGTTVQTLNNIRFADQYAWSQTGSVALFAGSNTITLATCPLGVNGTDTVANSTPHWLYVTAGAGDPNPNEPVLISGGTCTGGATSKTLIFSTAFSHCIAGTGGCTTSWTIGTATGGAQEAERDSPNPNTLIILAPHMTFQFNAPFFMSQNAITLSGSGSQVQCNVLNRCIMMGDPASAGTWGWQRIEGLRIRPGIVPQTATPTSPTAITAGSTSVTLTISTCPSTFYAAIPNQVLWLAGAGPVRQGPASQGAIQRLHSASESL